MEYQTTRTNPIKKFFLICSGADLGILSRPECSIELNKYIGIGATIFSTAVLASLSGGYALFTVFNSVPMEVSGVSPSPTAYILPICFGLLWGAIIFNLDRYIVSTIRKHTVPAGLSFRGLLQWKFSEFARFAPRLMLAIFISIIITRPIELKLFETEIKKEMLKQTSNDLANMKGKINEEYPDIERLATENNKLQKEITDKTTQVNSLYELALAEGMGEQRGNTTGRVGKGPFYKERLDGYNRAQEELKILTQANNAKITANETALAVLRRQKAIEEGNRQPTIERNGLVARLKTLNDLSDNNRPINLASWFLIFLFIMLETAPIIVKILSDRGPYDEIYETLEYSVVATEQKKSFEIDSELDTDMALSERLHAEVLAAKLQLSRRMMDSLETLAAVEIMEAQTEISRLIVEQWKKVQLDKLGYRAGSPNSARNGDSPPSERTTGDRSISPLEMVR
jgi:hypothetical protein